MKQGQVQFDHDQWQQAIKSFDESVRLAPRDNRGWLLRANAERASGMLIRPGTRRKCNLSEPGSSSGRPCGESLQGSYQGKTL
jgi:hypothetical protein